MLLDQAYNFNGGFKDNSTNIISLRGTMIPAKNINKILSKIPVVGEIIIPKEIGEGLFGVSFKIKETEQSQNDCKSC